MDFILLFRYFYWYLDRKLPILSLIGDGLNLYFGKISTILLILYWTNLTWFAHMIRRICWFIKMESFLWSDLKTINLNNNWKIKINTARKGKKVKKIFWWLFTMEAGLKQFWTTNVLIQILRESERWNEIDESIWSFELNNKCTYWSKLFTIWNKLR